MEVVSFSHQPPCVPNELLQTVSPTPKSFCSPSPSTKQTFCDFQKEEKPSRMLTQEERKKLYDERPTELSYKRLNDLCSFDIIIGDD